MEKAYYTQQPIHKNEKAPGTLEYLVFRHSILGTNNGQSIIKKISDVYSSRTCIHELNVMEYVCEYYTLEKEKLWILKNAGVARGLLTVTGKIEICMNYIMCHSFTYDNIREVDIKMEKITYSRRKVYAGLYLTNENILVS